MGVMCLQGYFRRHALLNVYVHELIQGTDLLQSLSPFKFLKSICFLDSVEDLKEKHEKQ
jgi:hypothetical protein